MKHIKTLSAGCLIAVFCLSTACTTDFEEINTNPNKMTVGNLQPANLLEPLLYDGSKNWQKFTWHWNNELIQFTAFTGGTTRQEHRYFISEQDYQSLWNFYSGYANNAVHLQQLAGKNGDTAYQAIALTLKVLFMSNLTDLFGDIPYKEAFQARVAGGTTTPVFESQKDVYEDMFADLEAANDLYATNPTMHDATLDGMYKGDISLWRKFNNSLYLRLICRVSGRSETNPSPRINAIMGNPDKYPVFTSNADNAQVNYSGVSPYVGYFDPTTTTESDFTSAGRKLTEQFIKMTVVSQNETQVYEDPRLPIWGKKKDPKGSWKGTVAGCTFAQMSTADAGSSLLNYKVLCRTKAPAFFMSYDEVEFILAEAALKGWISGGETAARTHYEAAVRASMDKWGEFGQYAETPVTITADDEAAFLESELASWDKHEDKEQLIAEQKFLALFWTGMEAYHEYRRTGFPALTIGEGTYNDHVLPTRFAYPSVTVATNSAHVEEALQRMGGENNMKMPVWWSLQAVNNN